MVLSGDFRLLLEFLKIGVVCFVMICDMLRWIFVFCWFLVKFCDFFKVVNVCLRYCVVVCVCNIELWVLVIRYSVWINLFCVEKIVFLCVSVVVCLIFNWICFIMLCGNCCLFWDGVWVEIFGVGLGWCGGCIVFFLGFIFVVELCGNVLRLSDGDVCLLIGMLLWDIVNLLESVCWWWVEMVGVFMFEMLVEEGGVVWSVLLLFGMIKFCCCGVLFVGLGKFSVGNWGMVSLLCLILKELIELFESVVLFLFWLLIDGFMCGLSIEGVLIVSDVVEEFELVSGGLNCNELLVGGVLFGIELFVIWDGDLVIGKVLGLVLVV